MTEEQFQVLIKLIQYINENPYPHMWETSPQNIIDEARDILVD